MSFLSILCFGTFVWCRATDLKTLRGAHEYDAAFQSFVQTYNKVYADEAEAQRRFAVFRDNYDKIETHNAQKNTSFSLGITMFADLTAEEFAKSYGSGKPSNAMQNGSLLGITMLGVYRYNNKTQLPEGVDWRMQGVLTPVKSQGQCGACWAFSSTGALEAAWKVATGTLVSLSEQQLLDCTSFNDYRNDGCLGGWKEMAFKYASTTAIYDETSYPYEAQDGTCDTSGRRVGIPKGNIVGQKVVEPTDAALMQAVSSTPVSISIEADQDVFAFYTGGIVDGECWQGKIDHSVLLVGYGTENGKDYWLIRNSWGTSWGEDGYVRILRGPTAGNDGECGILAWSSVYPVVRAQLPDTRVSLIAGAVLVSVIGLVVCCCVSKSLIRKCTRGTRQTAPLLEGRGRQVCASTSPAPITPAQVAGTNLQPGAETAWTGQKGNSRQSRLLQAAP